MNLSAIFSKTGKGVQEASGKTSHLSRADRAVLSAIDGKTPLTEVQKNFEKLAGPKFEALIQQLDKDGFIREVSSGSQSAAPARPTAPAAKPPPPKAAAPGDDGSDGLDFTQVMKVPPKLAGSVPKAPQMDLAAAARADVERKAQDQSLDYKARQEAELKAKAAAEAKAKAEAEARARAAAEAKARAEEEAKAHADSEARTRAEAEAKVKAAREAAVRMATEAKAKAEADARAKADAAERDKARLEADLNAKLEAERRAREDAERRATEAADRARKELEEKAKRDAEEMRQRLEAEMKAKLEEERKAREAEDRKRREEEDRRRKEEDERRAKEDAERRAREEADRKKREEEDRKRKEEDERRRKEEDERRAKQEAERRAKEEAERKKREEEERKRRENDERRRKDEDERRAKEDAERRAREDADRRAKEEAEAKAKARAAAEASASLPRIEPIAPPPPAPPPPAAAAPAGGDLGDLLGDLDSFGKREEEEQKAKEEAERKAKEAAARQAKEEAERKAKEDADKKRREEEERRRKEEEERRAKEEEENKAREEEERRKEEEAERKRKAKEALAAKQAEERAAKAAARKSAGKGDDDVEVGEQEPDLDDIKRDQKAMAGRAAARQREQPSVAAAVATGGRPKRWGKPAAIALFVVLIGGLAALNLMPVSTADYEKAASAAIGAPVKIGAARLSVFTGVEMRFENVAIGDAAKIRVVHGSPELGSLFGGRKSFSRLDLEGVSASQSQIADALLGKVSNENFRVGRVAIKQLSLEGPLKLPPLDVEADVAGDGSLQSVKLSGADKLQVLLTPKGNDIAFEISAGSLALPFVPAFSLSDFGMKGTANRGGITASEFDGRAYDGVISGTARIRWGATWNVEGEVRARALKVAVFAPALVSEGKVEGKAAYNMSGSTPATLFESARMQGEFKIEKGVLGSFDLTRALQTGGAQASGRTVFNELTGQGVYDKGTVQLRNVAIAAGAMNAGATIDIDANGGIAGRISADVKTPSQTLRATLNISGKVQDPVIRK